MEVLFVCHKFKRESLKGIPHDLIKGTTFKGIKKRNRLRTFYYEITEVKEFGFDPTLTTVFIKIGEFNELIIVDMTRFKFKQT